MMTLSEIRKKNQAVGGHFLDKKTLDFFKETLQSYKHKPVGNGLYQLVRKKDGRIAFFSEKTGRIDWVEPDTDPVEWEKGYET